MGGCHASISSISSIISIICIIISIQTHTSFTPIHLPSRRSCFWSCVIFQGVRHLLHILKLMFGIRHRCCCPRNLFYIRRVFVLGRGSSELVVERCLAAVALSQDNRNVVLIHILLWELGVKRRQLVMGDDGGRSLKQPQTITVFWFYFE